MTQGRRQLKEPIKLTCSGTVIPQPIEKGECQEPAQRLTVHRQSHQGWPGGAAVAPPASLCHSLQQLVSVTHMLARFTQPA